MKYSSYKVELEANYKHLDGIYNFGSLDWRNIFENYSDFMFCPPNRLYIVGTYLVLKDFVSRANKYDVAYYSGINTFLDVYKTAVENVVDFSKFEE